MVTVVLVLLALLVLDVMPTSLNIVAIAGIITTMIYSWQHLFKNAMIWYVLATVIAVTSTVFYESPYVVYVTKGYTGFALFLVVLMVGVLPNHWSLSRQIKKQRGLLSIVGFILISPHAILHVFDLYAGVNLFGIIAYVLMVPLTIVSFQIIKREIKPQDWLRIQQAAYVIYIALFIHLLLVGDWLDKVVYAVLLTLYVNNKLRKEWPT